MDGFKGRGNVIVIGATNRVDAIDSAARRRFDEEIRIDNPTHEELIEIFHIFLSVYKEFVEVEHTIDNAFIEKLCAEKFCGYTGSDIEVLFKKIYEASKMRCFKRIEGKFVKVSELCLAEIDIRLAVENHTPLYLRMLSPTE